MDRPAPTRSSRTARIRRPVVDRTTVRAALAVGALATALRIAWVLVASRPPKGFSDPLFYFRSSASLAAGDGYTSFLGEPTAYFPPGYSMFLAALHRVTDAVGLGGSRTLVIGLAQAVLGGVAAAAVVVLGPHLVGRRSHRMATEPTTAASATSARPARPPGLRLGITAGVLLAVWPNLVQHSALVLVETLYLAVATVLLLALMVRTEHLRTSAPRAPGRGPALIGVVVLGTAACTLIRPQSLLFMVPAAALAWSVGSGPRVAVRAVAPMIAGILLAIVPWTIRNMVVMDAAVPMSTNAGDNLCIGFHPNAPGSFVLPDECAAGADYYSDPRVEVERDRALRERTLQWLRERPTEIPRSAVPKLVATFGYDHDAIGASEGYNGDLHYSDRQRELLFLASNLFYWPVLGLAGVGTVIVVGRIRRERHGPDRGDDDRDGDESARDGRLGAAATNWLLVLCVTASGALVPVMFFGDPRFKIPLTPCLSLLAATAIGWLWDRRAAARAAAAPPRELAPERSPEPEMAAEQ